MKKNFDERFLKKIAPAGQIIALNGEKEVYHQHWGKKYRYFDLASLTKIFFTNEAMIYAVQQGLLKIDDPLNKYIPYWHNGVKVKNLLRHDSGYPWWQAFYKSIPENLEPELRYALLKNKIYKQNPKKTNRSVYSDIDYFILGFLLEKVFSMPLLEVFSILNSPFHFNHENKIQKAKKEDYAPTEHCPYRKKRLHGEVHDLNAWALGGVAPHAGLFGGKKEIIDWYKDFRLSMKRSSVQKKFSKRAIPSTKGDWALGYMLPTKGNASCGKHFSLQSVGHTGFTGTSFWYDPKKDFAVCILSNRVYYGPKSIYIRKARPMIHDQLFEEFL